MQSGEHEVLLVIADISGYTRFMVANRESLTHSQIIITELMKTVLKELKLPLRVSKLEGDAVFFYLRQDGNARRLAEVASDFRAMIERIFASFSERIAELVQANTCPCAGCRSVEMLRLKMVVHSGTALVHRVDRFTELSGFDVILVHRLLKNTIEGDEYVLLTAAARKELFALDEGMFEHGEERYDDVGAVSTFVYRPGALQAGALPAIRAGGLRQWRLRQIKVWSERLIRWRVLKLPTFRNLPADHGTGGVVG